MPLSPIPRRASVGTPSSASASRSATPLFSLSAAFGSTSTPPPSSSVPLSYATLPADALPPPPYTPDPIPQTPRLVEGTTYIERARLVRLSRSGINLHSLDTPAAPPPPVYVPPPPVFRHRAGPSRYTSEPSSRRGSVGDVPSEGGGSYRERARRVYFGQEEDERYSDRTTSSPRNGLSTTSNQPDQSQQSQSQPYINSLPPLSSSSTATLPVSPLPQATSSQTPPRGPNTAAVTFESTSAPSSFSPLHLDSDAHFAFLLQTALSPPPQLDPTHPDETYSDRARRLLRERAERIQVLEALSQIEGFVLDTTPSAVGGGGEESPRGERRGSGGEGGESYSERARRMLDERAENFRRFEEGEMMMGTRIGV